MGRTVRKSLKLFGGGGGLLVVKILMLNELCWDEIVKLMISHTTVRMIKTLFW